MDVFRGILGLAGGLALFLYGVSLMSSGLEGLSATRVRHIVTHCTRNIFAGLATGTVATVLIDSSSVVIILLIGTVKAGLATFEQAIGVILGANIGTTLSTQLYALQIEELAPVGLAVGFGLSSWGRSTRQKQIGTLLLGLGLLFTGLHLMSAVTAPFRSDPRLMAYVRVLEHPLKGALAGAVITAVIQSSSAMMGMVIALAAGGAITLPAAVALMFGAEIGTCADTLLATLGGSRDAILAGLFHLVFNVVSVALGLLLAPQFLALVIGLSGSAPVVQQIATAHILFNVLGVVLFVAIAGPVSRALRRLLPEPAATPYASSPLSA